MQKPHGTEGGQFRDGLRRGNGSTAPVSGKDGLMGYGYGSIPITVIPFLMG